MTARFVVVAGARAIGSLLPARRAYRSRCDRCWSVVGTSLVVGARVMLVSLSVSAYLRTPVYALAVERYGSGRAVTVVCSISGAWLRYGARPGRRYSLALSPGGSGGTATRVRRFAGVCDLVVGLVGDRPSAPVAAVVGGLAVGGAGSPLNTGIVVATVGGTVTGVLSGDREEGWMTATRVTPWLVWPLVIALGAGV